ASASDRNAGSGGRVGWVRVAAFRPDPDGGIHANSAFRRRDQLMRYPPPTPDLNSDISTAYSSGPRYGQRELDRVGPVKPTMGGGCRVPRRSEQPLRLPCCQEEGPVSTPVSGAKCSNCETQRPLQSVTVRVYFKRSQFDYRYRVCADCLRSLKSLLWCGATNVQQGMYDPPNAL